MLLNEHMPYGCCIYLKPTDKHNFIINLLSAKSRIAPLEKAFTTNTILGLPIERFSSLIKLKRVTAYCLRFITNLRTEKSSRHQGILSVDYNCGPSLLKSGVGRGIQHVKAYPLTPAHFLIGHLFTTLPDPDVRDVAQNRLNRYQVGTKAQQSVLGQMVKGILKIGSLVILKNEHSLPCHWKLGRIIQATSRFRWNYSSGYGEMW
ncbi:hypothetical protein PPYR_08319 [Photinus pyralis]|uniref:DUF5641 domain-containing protein n=1 Tax=Photinus pyralis TaxID=7054 RepID=A0A5N4AIZ3_PHOPY|nr:hypothetical protein PPYR_08319 [Photinus pyralis]